MEFQDYYETMGVKRDATHDEIKRAYRKLARKYHPDVSKEADAEAKFKAVGEAYAVLKDSEKRAAYDQLGENWQTGQDFRPPPDWDEGFEFSGAGGGDGFAGGQGREQFSDFFEQLFRQSQGQGQGQGPFAGGQGGQSFQQRGEDRHARISIGLRDSYTGAQRGITLHVPEETTTGHVITRDKTLNVKIPQGIRDGQKIRLTGQGGPGFGGAKAGDLFLEVEIKPTKGYRIDGGDVYLTLPVTPWEAALGSKVTVPIPSGDVELTIAKGSDQGSKMRLKAKGLPGKPPGDLYVVLEVRLPAADTAEAKALYEKMAAELPFNPRDTL
jgi:curved DNA-binding protein